MVSRPRRNTLVVLVVALTAVLMVSGTPLYTVTPAPGPDASAREFVRLGEDGSGPLVWPYTASGPTFERPVSPLNLVFETDPETVKELLRDRSIEEWNVSGPEAEGELTDHVERGLPWDELHSQDRHVYVTAERDGSGEWRDTTYQLHSGDYFGAQFHLRVYNATVAGEPPWTVIQAHGEHWDWFSLTHHVDSTEEPRQEIEAVFIDAPRPISVDREYFRNGDSFDADGWTTVVEIDRSSTIRAAGDGPPTDRTTPEAPVGLDPVVLGLLFVPAGTYAGRVAARSTTPTTRRLALFLAMAGTVLAIRIAGTTSEAVGLDHAVVSKALYLLMITGTPVVAAYLGRRLPTADAFALAGAGYAIGTMVDFMALSVGVLPIGLVVHRAVAAVALGGVAAAGVPRTLTQLRGNGLLGLSVLLWALVVLIPLL
ncbi:MAG: hypothetical protein ABEJ42_00825 [Halobacteriaceae archaeon]